MPSVAIKHFKVHVSLFCLRTYLLSTSARCDIRPLPANKRVCSLQFAWQKVSAVSTAVWLFLLPKTTNEKVKPSTTFLVKSQSDVCSTENVYSVAVIRRWGNQMYPIITGSPISSIYNVSTTNKTFLLQFYDFKAYLAIFSHKPLVDLKNKIHSGELSAASEASLFSHPSIASLLNHHLYYFKVLKEDTPWTSCCAS